jgi:Zn-dependent peptidase ImmA (M78 family)/transcriptional regulator with XRE-family HTH domain
MIGDRIKRARNAAGLSLRAVGEAAGLSATAVSKFETGKLVPASDSLIRLAKALGVRVEFFLRPESVRLEAPEYRKRASLGKKKLATIEADILDQVERYLELLSFFPASPVESFKAPAALPERVASYDDVEVFALKMRAAWKLGHDAIPNLADTFEEHGLLVLTTRLDESMKFDGLATKVGAHHVIVVAAHWPGDRQRFTMAHELGHLVLHGRVDPELDLERACNRFAGAFLVPAPSVKTELGEHRHRFALGELHALKLRYGVSMQGWVYRAKDLGIVSDSSFQATMRAFSAKGFRKQEPGERVPSEVPRLFEQLVLRALAEEMISESKAAELLATSVREFRDRLALEGSDGARRQ